MDILKKNEGLVWAQIHKYYLSDDPEAESLGMEALWSASQTFDSSKNIAFSTYATVCIYNALGCYVRTLNKKSKLEVVSYHAKNKEGGEYIENLMVSEGPDEVMSRNMRLKRIDEIVTEQLNLLSAKQKLIVEAWRDSGYSAKKTDLSKQIGVSQSYVTNTLQVFKHRLKIEFELEEIVNV